MNSPEISPLVKQTGKYQHNKKKLLNHDQDIRTDPDPSGNLILIQKEQHDG
jgi:hypothetical protein